MYDQTNFNGHCLINDNISIPKKVIYLSISCLDNPCLRNLYTDFPLDNCLFGSANLIVCNTKLRMLI